MQKQIDKIANQKTLLFGKKLYLCSLVMSEKHFHRSALCNEQLMRIDEVTQDIRKLSTFICLGCGQEMEACLGNKREHYFRHKNKENCSWESYLHKLSKMVLKARFEQQEQFLVHFNSVNTCEKIKICPFRRCKKEFVSELDLKEYYDTCEIEGSFRGFRADLLLTHSEHPGRALFLEVAVTHKCDEEKINSGIRIIEIDVTNEQSALLELDENNEQIHFYNFKFNREVVPLTNVERFSFLGCEKKIINRKIETIVCKNFNEHLPNALLDIVIRKPHNEINLESLGLAHVMVYGTYVRNCGFCNNREKCIIQLPKYDFDKETGKERIINCKFSPNQLSYEEQWLIARNCIKYSPDIKGCHYLIKVYGVRNYILWRKKISDRYNRK